MHQALVLPTLTREFPLLTTVLAFDSCGLLGTGGEQSCTNGKRAVKEALFAALIAWKRVISELWCRWEISLAARIAGICPDHRV
jgi:hypothetical protein